MGKRESQTDQERKSDGQSAEFRKLMLLCDEIFGKDDRAREERLQLAEYLLRRDIASFSQLEPHQVCRLLDALEGYELVTALKAMRPPAAFSGGGVPCRILATYQDATGSSRRLAGSLASSICSVSGCAAPPWAKPA